MTDFKPGDLVFHAISNASWNPRTKERVVLKTIHEGEVVWVKERSCGVAFKAGAKPKQCMKTSLSLRGRDG